MQSISHDDSDHLLPSERAVLHSRFGGLPLDLLGLLLEHQVGSFQLAHTRPRLCHLLVLRLGGVARVLVRHCLLIVTRRYVLWVVWRGC